MAHSCHDEHVHAGGAHEHKHDPEDPDGESLFGCVDTTKVWALNARRADDAKNPFKPYSERQNKDTWLDSQDDDPELIVHVPFTTAVRIKSLCVSGGEDGTNPTAVNVFVNREDIDFTNASDVAPTQRFELAPDPDAEIDYPVKTSKFGNVHSLTLFFDDSAEGDSTRVYYIGFKGVDTKFKRTVVECVYEARPALSDHKTKAETGGRAGV